MICIWTHFISLPAFSVAFSSNCILAFHVACSLRFMLRSPCVSHCILLMLRFPRIAFSLFILRSSCVSYCVLPVLRSSHVAFSSNCVHFALPVAFAFFPISVLPVLRSTRVSYCYSGASLWNSFPQEIRELQSFAQFKKAIAKHNN